MATRQSISIRSLVKVLKALGEPTRLKILRMLATRDLYVCELEVVLAMNQPRISQHLRVLKEAGLVYETKEAQRTLYSLDKETMASCLGDLQELLSAAPESLPEFAAEFKRLESLGDSAVQRCGIRRQ